MIRLLECVNCDVYELHKDKDCDEGVEFFFTLNATKTLKENEVMIWFKEYLSRGVYKLYKDEEHGEED